MRVDDSTGTGGKAEKETKDKSVWCVHFAFASALVKRLLRSAGCAFAVCDCDGA